MTTVIGERDPEVLRAIQEALERDQRGGKGSDDARATLYTRTYPKMRRHLFKKTRSYYPSPSDDDLDEIIQDAYSDVFRSLNTYDSSKSSFMTWVITIAIRRSYKWLAKATKNNPAYYFGESQDEEDGPSREPSTPGHIMIEEQQILKELLRFMTQVIRDVANEDYRIVVALVYFGWFTLLELRQVLGFNPNTLKSAYRRGLTEMKGKVSMRWGQAYEELAVQLMETHKRGSLAKGMAVLDTDYVDKIKDTKRRTLMRGLLTEELGLEEVARRNEMKPADVVRELKKGVDELLQILTDELA